MLLGIFVKATEDGSYLPTTLGYVGLVAIILLCMALALLAGSKKAKKRITTKQLVFSAVAMALSMVTSNLKLYEMPMGGSITLFSMLFICLIGYWFGLRAGLMTAVAYGFLQLLIDPYILGPWQLLVDYPLAFGALGLSGLMTNQKYGLIKGYLLGILGRFFFAFLSGWIFFGSYAPEGMHPMVYSFVYNIGYIGVEGVITVVVLAIPAVRKALDSTKNMALS